MIKKHDGDYVGKELLSSHEIKEELFRLLLAFREICLREHLRYTLASGTLLGAIRHQDFIPWDDDIDVFMPRQDYTRFIEISSKMNSQGIDLAVQNGCNGSNGVAFAKLVNTKIRAQEPHYYKEEYLWIDIMPLDQSASMLSQEWLKKARKLNDMAWKLTTIDHEMSKKRRFLLAINQATNGFFSSLLIKRCEAVYQTKADQTSALAFYEYSWSNYFGRGKIEQLPITAFDDMIDVSFHGDTFKAMSCWEENLISKYGDYLSLPPAEARTNHSIRAWYISE